MADALKAEGNKLFAAKDFQGSMCADRILPGAQQLTRPSAKFSEAIEVDPSNHVLYSNRSGSHASLKDFKSAFDDAVKTTEIKPDWAKGWSRKGAALHGMGDLGRCMFIVC